MTLDNREQYEEQLAKRLSKANREARAILTDALPDGQVTEEEWQAIAQVFNQVLQPALENVFVSSASAASVVGIEPEVILQDAIEWARRHTSDLVHQIDERSRQLLQASIADYFERRMTLADLQARIGHAFGPARASTIAVTEVTRAASAGEVAASARLRALGLKPVLVWQTDEDNLVCPICGPRNGRKQGDGWVNPPPAHPRCRCGLRTEIEPADGAWT